MSIVGYLTYCDATLPNILDSMQILDGWQSQLLLLLRAINVLKLAFALPLRFNVARAVLLGWFPAGPVSLLTSGLVGSAVTVAALPLQLNNVIGLTSSSCASFIICIFPGGLELALLQTEPRKKQRERAILAAGMVLFGLLLLTTGTYANLRRMLYS